MLLRPTALLFDMDGLLVDSEPLWFDVERAFAAAHGATWTDAHARACVGRGIATTLAFMRDELGVQADPARAAGAIVEAFVARVAELRLKPGAEALLDAARGRVPCALASSSARHLIDAVLGRFALGFDAVVSGEEVARPKPAPDIFVEAARRLGVPARGCVVLEDSHAGARAGQAAGAWVIAVPEHGADGFEGVADRVVADLFEARALLDLGAAPAPGDAPA